MVKTIKLGGGDYIFAANAATPYRYKQIFHEDLFQIFAHASQKPEESIGLADTVSKLAYIMLKQAEKADMNSLSEDAFYEWLEGFAPMDIVVAGEEIMNFYLQSTNGDAIPKKK